LEKKNPLYQWHEPHGGKIGACRTCGFFALDAAKNPDYPASLRSLSGKKPLEGCFLLLKRAKPDKLLVPFAGYPFPVPYEVKAARQPVLRYTPS
jgi:hypothetical protein